MANHIQKVAGPYVYTKPTGSQYSDPFTGSGRYLPGANQPQGSQSGTDPFTGEGDINWAACDVQFHKIIISLKVL